MKIKTEFEFNEILYELKFYHGEGAALELASTQMSPYIRRILKEGKGTFILYLGSDDIYKKQGAKEILKVMKKKRFEQISIKDFEGLL